MAQFVAEGGFTKPLITYVAGFHREHAGRNDLRTCRRDDRRRQGKTVHEVKVLRMWVSTWSIATTTSSSPCCSHSTLRTLATLHSRPNA